MNVTYQKLALTGLLAVSVGSMKGMETVDSNNNNAINISSHSKTYNGMAITQQVVEKYAPRVKDGELEAIKAFEQRYPEALSQLLRSNFVGSVNQTNEANFQMLSKLHDRMLKTNLNRHDKYIINLGKIILKMGTLLNRAWLIKKAGEENKTFDPSLSTYQTLSMGGYTLLNAGDNQSLVAIPESWLYIPNGDKNPDDENCVFVQRYIEDTTPITARSTALGLVTNQHLEALWHKVKRGNWPLVNNLFLKEGKIWILGGSQQLNTVKPAPDKMGQETGFMFSSGGNSLDAHAPACATEEIAFLLQGSNKEAEWIKLVWNDPYGQEILITRNNKHILDPLKGSLDKDQYTKLDVASRERK